MNALDIDVTKLDPAARKEVQKLLEHIKEELAAARSELSLIRRQVLRELEARGSI